jgi:type II secretory pathway component PulM
MPRRIKRRRFEAVTPTLAELQTKLDSVRREVRNLTVMGMEPNQTTEQAALVKELERSARAEQRLRKMALDYAKSRKT